MPDAVVDVAGDPGALTQDGGTHLVVLGRQEAVVDGLEGQDPHLQVVPDRVQAGTRPLLLDGAQGQGGGQGHHDHGDEGERPGPRPPPRHQERGAADRGQEAGGPGARHRAHQVVEGQGRPGHRRRGETAQQQVGGGDDDRRPPPHHRARPGGDDGQEQPGHGHHVHRPPEHRHQETACQDHALVRQNLHAEIMVRPRSRAQPTRGGAPSQAREAASVSTPACRLAPRAAYRHQARRTLPSRSRRTPPEPAAPGRVPARRRTCPDTHDRSHAPAPYVMTPGTSAAHRASGA